MHIVDLVEKYQCPGCHYGNGKARICPRFKVEKIEEAQRCQNHYPSTFLGIDKKIVGRIFEGLPNGFNRVGGNIGDPMYTNIYLFEKFGESGWGYDMFNVPVWKHLTKEGHTIVRVMIPRINRTDIHIYADNCIEKIDCLEITQEMVNEMD